MPTENSPPSVAEAIRDATAEAMRLDPAVILFGLGVNDPGRIFGTTAGLVEEFGLQRVFETPTAENAMMGVAIGAALGGFRPIVTHQRTDFFYLALDQLVNAAAKWRFMFGGQFTVPLVVRLIVGRGWGQGPTHSQNLVSWLSCIPGIRVFYPSTAANAKSLLLEAVNDDNPVVFIEDRWLHSSRDEGNAESGQSDSSIYQRTSGDDFTIVAFGQMVSEAIKASFFLERHGIQTEVWDICKPSHFDAAPLLKSVEKTRRVLVVEASPGVGSFGEALLGNLAQEFANFSKLPLSVCLISMPQIPQPTSYGATKGLYPDWKMIAQKVLDSMNIQHTSDFESLNADHPHDISPSGSTSIF